MSDPTAQNGRAGDEPAVARDTEVGKVLGTQDATPLDFWVAIDERSYLRLDDVVGVHTSVPGAGALRISGVVDMVRARHEGSRFDSDVFLADQGLLPVQTARASTSRTDLWDESSFSAARQSALNCSRSNMWEAPFRERSRQVYNTASCVFCKSVISIRPGACVIANGIFAAAMYFTAFEGLHTASRAALDVLRTWPSNG